MNASHTLSNPATNHGLTRPGHFNGFFTVNDEDNGGPGWDFRIVSGSTRTVDDPFFERRRRPICGSGLLESLRHFAVLDARQLIKLAGIIRNRNDPPYGLFGRGVVSQPFEVIFASEFSDPEEMQVPSP